MRFLYIFMSFFLGGAESFWPINGVPWIAIGSETFKRSSCRLLQFSNPLIPKAGKIFLHHLHHHIKKKIASPAPTCLRHELFLVWSLPLSALSHSVLNWFLFAFQASTALHPVASSPLNGPYTVSPSTHNFLLTRCSGEQALPRWESAHITTLFHRPPYSRTGNSRTPHSLFLCLFVHRSPHVTWSYLPSNLLRFLHVWGQ